MGPQQHFFQQFFGPQQVQNQPQIPEYIIHNEIVLEIINNWDVVIQLMNKFYSGQLKQVDRLEQDWFNFISRNSIDMKIYQNKEEFFNAYWKIPQN